MNRRQRKKNRRGEFVVHGFEVRADLRFNTLADEVFWDALIAFVEARELYFVGGASRTHLSGIVTAFQPRKRRSYRDRSCTGTDQMRVESWLRERPEIDGVSVGPLVDAAS